MRKTVVCDNPYLKSGQQCKEQEKTCLGCNWYDEDTQALVDELKQVRAKERELQKRYHALTGVYFIENITL